MNIDRKNALNAKYRHQLEVLVEQAPNISLRDALRIITDNENLRKENLVFADVIMVLITDILGMDERGHISDPNMRDLINSKLRTLYAYHEALKIHAGWACSPFSGGIESCMKSIDTTADEVNRTNKLYPIPKD